MLVLSATLTQILHPGSGSDSGFGSDSGADFGSDSGSIRFRLGSDVIEGRKHAPLGLAVGLVPPRLLEKSVGWCLCRLTNSRESDVRGLE